MSDTPPVYVIVVNWNGWQDTLECLESLLRSDYPDYRVLLCDNGSSDGSPERIADWIDGRLPAPAARSGVLGRLSRPPVAKPVSRGRLELIQTGANLGFAGGNNVALRLALQRDDFEYAWLLNNDTVVEKDALSQLVAHTRARPGAGICGSTIRFYDDIDQVQAYGGASYDRWFGVPCNIDTLRPGETPAHVEGRLAYVMGASMLVSRSFVRDVGLLSEDYFLFCEEIDWATRGRGRYSLAYAPLSLVYHKGGRSTGYSHGSYSATGDYFMLRSQLLYARRHTPWALPFVFLRHLLVAANSVRTGRLPRLRLLASIYAELLRGRFGAGSVPRPRPPTR